MSKIEEFLRSFLPNVIQGASDIGLGFITTFVPNADSIIANLEHKIKTHNPNANFAYDIAKELTDLYQKAMTEAGKVDPQARDEAVNRYNDLKMMSSQLKSLAARQVMKKTLDNAKDNVSQQVAKYEQKISESNAKQNALTSAYQNAMLHVNNPTQAGMKVIAQTAEDFGGDGHLGRYAGIQAMKGINNNEEEV